MPYISIKSLVNQNKSLFILTILYFIVYLYYYTFIFHFISYYYLFLWFFFGTFVKDENVYIPFRYMSVYIA